MACIIIHNECTSLRIAQNILRKDELESHTWILYHHNHQPYGVEAVAGHHHYQ